MLFRLRAQAALLRKPSLRSSLPLRFACGPLPWLRPAVFSSLALGRANEFALRSLPSSVHEAAGGYAIRSHLPFRHRHILATALRQGEASNRADFRPFSALPRAGASNRADFRAFSALPRAGASIRADFRAFSALPRAGALLHNKKEQPI